MLPEPISNPVELAYTFNVKKLTLFGTILNIKFPVDGVFKILPDIEKIPCFVLNGVVGVIGTVVVNATVLLPALEELILTLNTTLAVITSPSRV